MIKSKRFTTLLLVFVMLIAIVAVPVGAFNSDNDKETEIYVSINDDPNGISAKMNELFESGKTSVTVYYTDLKGIESNIPEIIPFMHRLVVRNATSLSQSTGTNTIGSVTGNAVGQTIQISTSKKVSASVSATFGASKSDITAQVGFNVANEYTLQLSSSYTIPRTANGKNVKTATINAYPKYNRTQYQVWKVYPNLPSSQDELAGTGIAYKPVGVTYKVSYTYF